MVSLVNFKSFSEDILQQQQPHSRRANEQRTDDYNNRTRLEHDDDEDTARTSSPSASRNNQQPSQQDKSSSSSSLQYKPLNLKQVNDAACDSQHRTTINSNSSDQTNESTSILMLNYQNSADTERTTNQDSSGPTSYNQFNSSKSLSLRNDKNNNQNQQGNPINNNRQQSHQATKQVTSFTITWRNLKFSIEPKWHQKLANSSSLGRLVGRWAGSGASDQPPQVAAATTGGSAFNSVVPLTSQIKNKDADLQLNLHHTNTNSSPQSSSTSSQALTRVVLDRLDGSFKSGELTAILGPSGAGKTTLLDCLTGHRKHGLSGSIRISSSSSTSTQPLTGTAVHSTNCPQHNKQNVGCCFVVENDCGPNHHQNLTSTLAIESNLAKLPSLSSSAASSCSCRCTCSSWIQQQQQQQQSPLTTTAAAATTTNSDNLKVSIIPQNDHLMGHLTVYETLNYASKMKNCFDKQFNHKLNIRRVAQQLGLMTCLGTRINKLSGGQYKRVSIAQELLSSPDILILDEPTSGLDAMTCYQTVQVLKKLTDEMRTSDDGGCNGGVSQKQIAVILTIHQPNSDVFQQFNNVYVVAQGGKCIYEGPPSGIESVINRIGIHLPNSYYNPATMIVEIAAGKFGLEAIQKLNSIQRKQYNFIYSNDEQQSTGDSAVDCPSTSTSTKSSSSSSSPSSSDNEEEEEEEEEDGNVERRAKISNNNNYLETICCDNIQSKNKKKKKQESKFAEINNNNDEQTKLESGGGGGLINKGFIIEDDGLDSLKGASETIQQVNNNNIEIYVVPQKPSHVDYNQQLLTNGRSKATGEPTSGLSAAVHEGEANNNNKRKKRRRRRLQANKIELTSIGLAALKSSSTTVAAFNDTAKSDCNSSGSGGSGGGGGGGGGREKRLKLNSLKADQRFPFWRHTYLHFHRSWLSIVRDPMLCSMQLALHIIVPVMVSLVYGTTVGKPNACPRAGPVDIMAYALEPTDTALQLQEDLRTTLENIGYIFFKLYGIIFAAMTVTVLTFPLDMHVLVKEFRNGWYGLSSYFLGRTLADIPFQLTLPLLAMSLSYYATGQPYSYMQWRFLSITAILILSSLIAQSQGLLFGAILMDKMKAAVFVAPAATTPIILFAGFLVRTQSIPRYLRPLSNLSYLRYAIEACLISRYGFNQCECDPAIFNQTVPELPPIARSMLDYWLGSFKSSSMSGADSSPTSSLLNETTTSTNHSSLMVIETTTVADLSADRPDLFTKLIDSLAKANSFGRNITSCEQVVPYPMIDYDLKDSQLVTCFAILLVMLVFTRLLTFFIVCFKVKRKV